MSKQSSTIPKHARLTRRPHGSGRNGDHMRSILRIYLGCAMVLAGSLECAKADDVIFTNFGLSDSFALFGLGFGRVPGEALRGYTGTVFRASGSFRLNHFTVAVSFSFVEANPPSPQPFDVLLMSTASTGLPGRVIESFEEFIDTPSPAHLVTINSVLHPTLIEGACYWIVTTAGSATNSLISGAWQNSIG